MKFCFALIARFAYRQIYLTELWLFQKTSTSPAVAWAPLFRRGKWAPPKADAAHPNAGTQVGAIAHPRRGLPSSSKYGWD